MKFKIPATYTDFVKLKSRSKFFSSRIKPKKKSQLGTLLKNINIHLTREEYLGIAYYSFANMFVYSSFLLSTMFFIMQVRLFYAVGIGLVSDE